MTKNKTPIALFVYSRPDHARTTIHSITSNPGWQQHPITVYCDGPAQPHIREQVMATRNVVREMLGGNAKIIEREENIGLANSLIAGITEQTAQYGRVIVLEDDLVLSPCALEYFTMMLDRYEHEERVMHISGYSYPITEAMPELFFTRECTCWGWATWQRAWKHFNPDATALLQAIRRQKRQRDFDIEGTAQYNIMLEQQAKGGLDSWFIRWYASVFLHNGLSLFSARSYIRNNGLDGTGVHCRKTQRYNVALNDQLPRHFPDSIEEYTPAIAAISQFHSAGNNQLELILKRAILRWLPQQAVKCLLRILYPHRHLR